jgi:hypothetical protein
LQVLNDKETVAYLNETMGPQQVKELRDTLENIDKLQKAFDQAANIEHDAIKVEKLLSLVYDLYRFAKSPHKIGKIIMQFAKNPLWLRDLSKMAKEFAKENLHTVKTKVKGFNAKTGKAFQDYEGFTDEQIAKFVQKNKPRIKYLASHLPNDDETVS